MAYQESFDILVIRLHHADHEFVVVRVDTDDITVRENDLDPSPLRVALERS